jgi:hypothetical protein
MLHVRGLLVALVAGVQLVACGSPTVAPSQPAASLVDQAPLDASELEAKRFRDDFGLRSDAAWIRQVAANPSSDSRTFGVPLTVDEVAELNRRSNTNEELKATVLAYALEQPDYAGAFIDHDRDGLFIVQFAGPILGHQLEIFRLIRPGAQIEVRAVRWSWDELVKFEARIDGDTPWFDSIPAYLLGHGPDVVLNRITIQVSSADPAASAKIQAHFGWTDEIVVVESDGTGALLQRPGKLAIRAVDPAGTPVADLACVVSTDAPNVHEPRPIPMPTTDSDGACDVEALPGDYSIELESGQDPRVVVAIGQATVTSRKLTTVTMVVP